MLTRMEEISILLNGERRSVRKGISVQELLRQMKVPVETVVVDVNEAVLARESYGTVQLREGDRVELVRFVGGGAPGANGIRHLLAEGWFLTGRRGQKDHTSWRNL